MVGTDRDGEGSAAGGSIFEPVCNGGRPGTGEAVLDRGSSKLTTAMATV